MPSSKSKKRKGLGATSEKRQKKLRCKEQVIDQRERRAGKMSKQNTYA